MAKEEGASLKRPKFDIDQLSVEYLRDSDTLMIHLVSPPGMATSEEVDRNLYFRVDRETNEVVGFQVENFLRAVAPMRPEMLRHPEALGITEADIKAARPKSLWRRLVPDLPKKSDDHSNCDTRQDRRAALRDLDTVFGQRMQMATA